MSTRLYYDNPYLTTFDATVTACEPRADAFAVRLDRTAFYPSSGGQPFDTGTLDDARVADVVDEDDDVVHVVERSLDVGATVHGAIDWTRRFDHMQQHTGQHLLTAVFVELFGYDTVSVHFGVERSSLDLDTGTLSTDQLIEAERRGNEIVWENRPVSVTFEDSAAATGLRKPPPRSGTIRVVTIDRLDRSACGGTHVRATGEIGAAQFIAPDAGHQLVKLQLLFGEPGANGETRSVTVIVYDDTADTVIPGEVLYRGDYELLAVGDGKDIRNIVLVGGAAALYRNGVQRCFPRHRVHTVADAVFANVRGFQRAGEQLLESGGVR